jgi:hypothetical protein
MKPLISLLTDFGTKDPFVGEMKAVVFLICPSARVIDITHEVQRFDIRMGAFVLASASPHFPVGTVHVAVVDPGVGTERRPIAVQTKRALYVGPDNGLLIPSATREGIQHVYELTNRALMMYPVSATFHGRDIFAPVAAYLACGTPPKEVGEEITDYVQLSFGEPTFKEHGATCEAIHIDHFGNIVTNISQRNMGRLKTGVKFVLAIHRKRFHVRLVKAYREIGGRELGLIVGSHGFVEIASRESSAGSRLRARAGDTILISWR